MLLLAALGLLAWRMATLAPPAPPTDQKPTEVQALFEALRQRQDSAQEGLIRLEVDGRLTLPEPDHALKLAWQRGEAEDKALARLLRDLYGSAAGKALQGQFAQWNHGRRVAAVRDNHGGAVTHANWRAYDCEDGALLSGEVPVPERFGYIHQGRIKTGFGDWHAVGADRSCVEFRGHLRATQPAEVAVLYLGTPLQPPVSLGALKAYDPRHPFAAPQCPGFRAIPTGQVGEGVLPKSAWRRASDGVWEVEARLRLAPAVNPDLKAPDLRVAFDAKSCQAEWQPELPTDSTADHAAIATLGAADGPLLVDAAGNPTPDARRLGLVPLVGFGPRHFASLSGLLRRSHGVKHLTLTVDTRIQAVAREALLKNLPADRYADERRAVLVVLDATDGAILATVAYPEPPPLEQVLPWDFLAFSRVYGDSDPLRVFAWEGSGRHYLAGSTLKPVVALAALAAAKQGNADIAGMLAGWPPRQFERNTGLTLASTGIDPNWGVAGRTAGEEPRLIRNSDGESLGYLLNKPLRDPQCAADAGKSETLGLAPALRDSLNSWFIALALRLDGTDIDAFDADPRLLKQRTVPDLWFIKTLRQMGFGESQPLFAQPPVGVHPRKRPEMIADTVDLLNEHPTPLRWVVAQAAIGQGVAVTPLRMATLAASLSRGAMIHPRLDAAWDGRTVVSKASLPLGVDLTGIRAGMKAVPEVGTAKQAFAKTPPAIRCRTYAKTGTAEIGQTDGSGIEPYNTGWLIGWHEPEQREARRLAFACMITHAARTGGAVCGPVVADLLKRLSLPSP
jgi:cell division protein FtsI/penicillin-binding protein 2